MTRSWKPSKTRRQQAQRQRQAPRFRPCLEALEERYLLSTYTVANLNDNGAGSLRAAVSAADANSGSTIDFTSTLAGGTISLTSGQLNVSANMTITGLGANSLTISGGGLSRVFDISSSSATVSISSLTISGGSVSGEGGGIYNAGALTLSDDSLSGNNAIYGGGIFSANTLTVNSNTLSGNSASSEGGGLYNGAPATINSSSLSSNSASAGGGIYNSGFLSLMSNSSLSSNSASSNGGGIWNQGSLTVSGSTLASNSAGSAGYGGGIYNGTGGTVHVTSSSSLSGNSAHYGGGIFNDFVLAVSGGSTVSSNSASGEGGGIYNGVNVMVSNSATLSSNTASYGGGIFVASGTLSIASSTLSGNSASQGGGVYNESTLTVSDSTLSGNSSSYQGGGVYNSNILTLGNSTLSGNSSNNGGGIYIYYSGPPGPIETATLTNATIANNTSLNPGAGIDVASGGVLLHNTLVAGNLKGGTESDVNGSLDNTCMYNLIGDGSGGLSSSNHNLLGTSADPINPLLSVLGNYGGSTETLALLPGSPAIDAGSSIYGGSTDQRGVTRPGTNSETDIGAFESQGFTIAVTSGNNQSTEVGDAFEAPLVVTVTANKSIEPVADGEVTFTAPSSGASAIFSNGSNIITATIASDGQASVMAKANGTPGSYTVIASATGIASPADFTLTNTP